MASDKTTTTKRRYIDMQSPILALLYGIAIWFVWVSLVAASAQVLPTGISGSALFVSMQTVALAALVLGSTVAVAPSYVVAPFTTTLTMGYLERRPLKPGS